MKSPDIPGRVKPLQYKPVRRIDPRIAWANGVITRATETPAMSGS
jgi:hypothetical protein